MNSNSDAGVRLFTAAPVAANFANSNGPPLAWDWTNGVLYGLKNDATVVPLGGSSSGTVTSINVSGGTTGLTASGGPITTTGTITLSGTLDVDNGGTGAASLTSNQSLWGSGTSPIDDDAGFTRTGAAGRYLFGATDNGSSKLQVSGTVAASSKIFPGTDAAAAQTACGVFAGSGAPNNANGADGDVYFRSDGGALTTIYQRRAGAWTGII